MKAEEPRQLKILQAPYFERNPYQKLLIKGLKDAGAEILLSPSNALRLLFTCVSKRPDVLHIHWQTGFLLAKRCAIVSLLKSLFFIFVLAISKMMNIRIVWTAHNLKNHENRLKELELYFTGIIVRMADIVIAHCEAARTEIVKTCGVSDEGKVIVIPHGNFTDSYDNSISREAAREEIGIAADDLVFLFFGVIRDYKGLPELLESFRYIHASNIKLLIAGLPCGKNVKERIKRNSIEDERILPFLEFVPEDDIQKYMNASDIMVLPYREVLTSGAVVLALSFGKPVIAPYVGCIPEYVGSSAGILYNPDEEGALSDAMSRAVNMREQLHEMAGHSRELGERLAWKGISQKTYAIYESLLYKQT